MQSNLAATVRFMLRRPPSVVISIALCLSACRVLGNEPQASIEMSISARHTKSGDLPQIEVQFLNRGKEEFVLLDVGGRFPGEVFIQLPDKELKLMDEKVFPKVMTTFFFPDKHIIKPGATNMYTLNIASDFVDIMSTRTTRRLWIEAVKSSPTFKVYCQADIYQKPIKSNTITWQRDASE